MGLVVQRLVALFLQARVVPSVSALLTPMACLWSLHTRRHLQQFLLRTGRRALCAACPAAGAFTVRASAAAALLAAGLLGCALQQQQPAVVGGAGAQAVCGQLQSALKCTRSRQRCLSSAVHMCRRRRRSGTATSAVPWLLKRCTAGWSCLQAWLGLQQLACSEVLALCRPASLCCAYAVSLRVREDSSKRARLLCQPCDQCGPEQVECTLMT